MGWKVKEPPQTYNDKEPFQFSDTHTQFLLYFCDNVTAEVGDKGRAEGR